MTGLKEILDEFVKDRTNANFKSKILELCEAVEKKDSQMVDSGKEIVQKLVSVRDKIKVALGLKSGLEGSTYEYPTDSLHNILKNLECLSMDLEDKSISVEYKVKSEKKELLGMV